jgi:hypothetical protein
MEKNLVELSASEILEISGGNMYELGKSFGSYCADCVDFYNGIVDGFMGEE